MTASPQRRPAPRSGRPPRQRGGEVDGRILDAAEQVFLQRGFEGASIDEVAEVAHAGKTTIYARHASKQDLFAAVVLRNVSDMLQIVDSAPHGATLEARLRILGADIIQRATSPKTIRLFRVTLSEAERFPQIASQVSHLARERGIDEVARLLAELDDAPEACRPVEADAGPPLREAKIFMDLIVLPMVLRRLFGESAAALQAEISDHVADRVAYFLGSRLPGRPSTGDV